jgi:chromosome segregation ATPase
LQADHPEREIIDLTEDDDEGQQDRRFIWVSQPNSDAKYFTSYTDNNCDQDQPPEQTNGTLSESLTRLQSGFLRCIANLEERNIALQEKIERVRMAPDNWEDKIDLQSSQRICILEEHIAALQQQLDETRARPNSWKAQLTQLNETLATKNKAIKEKNLKIIEIEQRNAQLQRDLAEARKNSGANMEASRKMSTSQMKRKHGDFGNHIPRASRDRWGP